MIYSIIIQKFVEKKIEYFIATCEEVPWFMTEWKSEEEVKENVSKVLPIFIKKRNERKSKEMTLKFLVNIGTRQVAYA